MKKKSEKLIKMAKHKTKLTLMTEVATVTLLFKQLNLILIKSQILNRIFYFLFFVTSF